MGFMLASRSAGGSGSISIICVVLQRLGHDVFYIEILSRLPTTRSVLKSP